MRAVLTLLLTMVGFYDCGRPHTSRQGDRSRVILPVSLVALALEPVLALNLNSILSSLISALQSDMTTTLPRISQANWKSDICLNSPKIERRHRRCLAALATRDLRYMATTRSI